MRMRQIFSKNVQIGCMYECTCVCMYVSIHRRHKCLNVHYLLLKEKNIHYVQIIINHVQNSLCIVKNKKNTKQ